MGGCNTQWGLSTLQFSYRKVKSCRTNLVAIIGKMWHITNVPKSIGSKDIGTLQGELLRGGSLNLQRTLNKKPRGHC